MVYMYVFLPFPNIETPLLHLRRLRREDASDLFEMRSDLRMHEHTDTSPDNTPEESLVYIDKMNRGVDEGRWVIWAIEHKGTGAVIGTISIWNFDSGGNSGELGYGLIPSFQGQGLMKESLLAVTDYGFKHLHLQTMEAYTDEQNHSSSRVLEACGFARVKTVREEGYVQKRVFDMAVYTKEKGCGTSVGSER